MDKMVIDLDKSYQDWGDCSAEILGTAKVC